MIVGGYRVGPLLKKTWSEIVDDNVFGLAAQTAYYFFFSLFPLLLFIAPLLSVIGDKRQIVGWILTTAGRAVPPEALSLVNGVVKDVVLTDSAPGLMSVGALLAAWSGSNVFGALMGALNRAYDVRETRPWVKQQIIRLGSLLVAGVVLMLATAVMLGGDQIVDWISNNVGLSRGVATLWKVLQFPFALGILIGTAWMLYFFLPNVKQRARQVLVCALVAAVLWVVGTLLFRAYVQNFGSYNKTYGAIGGVIALLTWMYLTMLILLVGGELASELHCGTARIEPERGATYAGRIGSDGSPGRPSTERVERVEPLVARGSE